MSESRNDGPLVERLTSYLEGYATYVPSSTSRSTAPLPGSVVVGNGQPDRHHRWLPVVATFLAVVVALGAASAVLVLRASHNGVATLAPSAPKGWRLVSYRGVHITVPDSWPIVDGMHALYCGDPFPTTPTAFVGPQEGPGPGCPPSIGPEPARDGAWLRPEGTPAPPDAHPVTTTSGQSVLEELPGTNGSVENLWYHGILVEVGIGPTPDVAKTIVNSIGFASNVSDTAASGVCPRSPNPMAMPTPQREDQTARLNRGEVTLDPPLPSDQPAVTATQIWNESGPKSPFDLYHVILARYSASFPAHQNPDGSLTPLSQHQLAWVIYATPLGTAVADCGGYGADVFDALTGQGISSSGWSPGP
jgi:hypothetical protein